MKFKLGVAFLMVLVIGIFSTLNFSYASFVHQKFALERIWKTLYYALDNQYASIFHARESVTTLAVPFHRQEHALTCETAALRMALNFHGAKVTEEELLDKLKFSDPEPMNTVAVWGDPAEGFVGLVDGSVFEYTGFGVYEKPIEELANQYKVAEVLENAELEEVISQVLGGNPVITWGLLSKRDPKYWYTHEGELIEIHPGEHARVVIGFTGNPRDPERIILMDPIYGKIRMKTEKFLRDWKVMENRAVVVYNKNPNSPEFASR